MEVLASRFILHPSDMARSRHFYEKGLGLRILHEYGDGSAAIGGDLPIRAVPLYARPLFTRGKGASVPHRNTEQGSARLNSQI